MRGGRVREGPFRYLLSVRLKTIDCGHGYKLLRNLEVCDEQEEHTLRRIVNRTGFARERIL